MESLAKRSSTAIQWSMLFSIATFVTQLAITTILGRLLMPADFGLYAIANVGFVLAVTFGDRGLISAIIREPVLDQEIIGSSMLLSLFISIFLTTIMILLTPLAGFGSAANEKSVVEGLFLLMSLSVFISGVSAPARAILARELRVRESSLIQLTAVVFGTGVLTIVLAFADYGPWSLVCGNIASMAINSAGCWWRVRDRWSISWRATHIIRIGLVGMQMMLLRVLDSLWNQLPLIIGHVHLSSTDVGLYQRAQTIVNMGIQSTSGRVDPVLFAVLASRQDKTEALRELMPALIGLYALFHFSVTGYVAVMASDIVALLLGPNWKGATDPLTIIMIASVSLIVTQPASNLLEVGGGLRLRIIGAGFGAACVAACSLLLIGRYGLIGIAIAAVISGAGMSVINIVGIVWHYAISPRAIVVWLIPGIITTGLITGALMVCRFLLFDQVTSYAIRIAITLIISGLVFVIGFRLSIGESKRQMLSKYFLAGASWKILAIARVFGLRAK